MLESEEKQIIPEGANQIALFKDKKIRQTFHNNEWWFSVVDTIEALTGTDRPSKYWNDLKSKIAEEDGGALSDKIGKLKLPSADGRM
jgi:prophage antirepressor-like protein